MAAPIVTQTLYGVSGDVPAEARLVVTDGSGSARRYIEHGLESRYLNTATSLQLNAAASMTLLGGTSTTRSGSVNTNVIRGTLTTTPSAIAGTGNLSHTGSFRIRARVYASSATVYVRLSYSDGSGIFRANDYALPPQSGGWSDVDLGTITVTPALSGIQAWSGRVEAIGVAGDTVDVDYLLFFPAGEGYGKARAAYNYTPGSLVARDEFTGTTAGAVLNARVAPTGGTWATSGAATDFVAADAPAATDETVSRSTTADTGIGRVAILGSTSYTDLEVGVQKTLAAGGFAHTVSLFLRYVDASNYLRAVFIDSFSLYVEKVVAGVTTQISPVVTLPTSTAGQRYGYRAIAFASGGGIATFLNSGGAELASVRFVDSAVATGGTLASGKPGFADYSSAGGTAVARYYDSFYAATPATEPIAVYGGRQAEIRSDSAIRQDSGGTVYGPVPSYYGAHLFVPPAGTANRPTRIAVRAARNDLEAGAYDNPTDKVQIQTLVTPRYLLPR
jgi:hypothetical protein